MSERSNSLLPSLSINRPTTVSMILLSLLVVGSIAMFLIPIALFPDGMENPQLYVSVSNPNSNPTDSEEQVTRPIEDALGTVPGIKRVYSQTRDSFVNVNIQFHKGVDLSEAYANVSDRMERVMPEMPDEVERINIFKWDSTDIPIVWAAMTFDEENMDVDFLAERYVLPAFQRINGVGNVEINGVRGREVRIELDQDKLKAHNISVVTLGQSLSDQNFNLSAGKVVEGESERYVRSVGRLKNLAEFEAILVDAESNIKLGDIAKVSFRPQENWNVFSLEREKSYGLSFSRSSGANIVEVCESIKATMRELESNPELADLKFHIFWNQGDHVSESVSNLKQSGLWGGFFSVVVLFLYLRSFRLTLTITLAIPLSLLCSVITLYFLGWSLNIATMMGLLLSVGLVVDNSIVIVENIQIKRLQGLDPSQAAIKGSSEMGLAITLATLTTIVVFLPLILMGDGSEMQFWLLRIGVPVMTSLMASLIIALLLIPLSTKVFADKRDLSTKKIGNSRASVAYLNVLRWSLAHRSYVSITLIILLGLSYFPYKKISQSASSGGGNQSVALRYDFPGGQSLEDISAYLSGVFDYIETKQESYNFTTYSSKYSASFANVELHLDTTTKPWFVSAYQGISQGIGLSKKARLSRQEIIEDLRKNITPSPGSRLRLNRNEEDPAKSFNISLYGDDTKTLRELSKEVERRLRSVEGLIAVESEDDTTKQELNLTIDREKALRFGIDTRMISGAVSYAIRGNQVGYFYDTNGRQTRIRIWIDEEDRETVAQLRKTTFDAEDGSQIPLESLVSLSYENGSNSIRRQDRKTVLRIKGIANEDDSKELFKQTDAVMQGFEMPRGYRWDKGGQYQQMQESNQSFTFTLIMIIVFIILLMGAMFESFLLPFCVFLTMPLAGVGVVWTLYLTKTSFNIMASIGIIILLGVVVNNGIVLIDLVTRLRKEGFARTEAIIEAGKRRFRPIWMTSLTTIFGMVPMSLGDTKMMDMSYSPLGRAMMGGMLTSTVLTLLIIPLFYTLFDDLRILFFNRLSSIFSWRRKAPQAPAAEAIER
jgi:HAE1 family hydrophobic/amphiphilic exporter-1